VDGIKAPKRNKTLPKALSADDAVRLVAYGDAGGAQSAMQKCNHAMFELLYSSGLRVSELVGLDLHYVNEERYISQGWIDLEAQEVTVTAKGTRAGNRLANQCSSPRLAPFVRIARPAIFRRPAGGSGNVGPCVNFRH